MKRRSGCLTNIKKRPQHWSWGEMGPGGVHGPVKAGAGGRGSAKTLIIN